MLNANRASQGSRFLALGQEVKALQKPVNSGYNRCQKQQQRKVPFNDTEVPGTDVSDKRCQYC